MANEYSDFRCQDAYESGIKDAVEEFFPSEPPESAREWWDEHAPTGLAPDDGNMPDYTRDEIEQMQQRELTHWSQW